MQSQARGTNRRTFLHTSGLMFGLGLAPWNTAAWGAAAGRRSPGGGSPGGGSPGRQALVVVFLRGGMDGLNLIVPYADPNYGKLRRAVALRAPGETNGVIELDGFFGLHPAAEALTEAFASGTAVALHAVGHEGNTRSHFEEQDVWETGLLASDMQASGWLNRHLVHSEGHGPVRAVAVGDTLPRLLRGEAEALAIRGLDDLAFGAVAGDSTATALALNAAYGGERPLERGGRTTLAALEHFKEIAAREYESDVRYPDGELGRRMRELARVLKADVGLEVAAVDFGGWDTHQNQGGVNGPFAQLVRQLAGSLDAFGRDLGERLDDTLVLVVSEFGRTAAENGTAGTDHGWGNAMLAFGGPVRAAGHERKVLGEWPGLAPDRLHQGRDLQHTTDFRDVFSEVLTRHLGHTELEKLLPGYEPRPVGLIA